MSNGRKGFSREKCYMFQQNLFGTIYTGRPLSSTDTWSKSCDWGRSEESQGPAFSRMHGWIA